MFIPLLCVPDRLMLCNLSLERVTVPLCTPQLESFLDKKFVFRLVPSTKREDVEPASNILTL